jgi:hypothetical protein
VHRTVWSGRALLCAAIGALGLVYLAPRVATQALTTCDAANPFDEIPDDVALQACLDAYDRVLLRPDGRPGYVGYMLANTLKPKRPGQLLTSAAIPQKATVVAAPGLGDAMLRVNGLADFEISFIRFDGNREQRPRGKPCVPGNDFRNVELTGTGFHVRYVESFGAVCGSAMTVGGSSGFEIYQSLFYDNGRQPEEADGVSGLWADGLTVFDCRNSTIRDNDFWDNTDVDLGVNGGRSLSAIRRRRAASSAPTSFHRATTCSALESSSDAIRGRSAAAAMRQVFTCTTTT